MTHLLLLSALVILACVLCNKLSSKLGVPTLLAFILLGMFFGSDGVVKIPFDNYGLAQNICSFALIFIMFYGGFGTNWSQAKPVAGKAAILSSFGTAFTAGLGGPGRWCCPPWAWRSPRCSQRCSATWHWVFLLWRAF